MTHRPIVVVVPTERFVREAARRIAFAIGNAVGERGHCSLVLSGGATPIPVYKALAGMHGLPWHLVDVFFGDERGVPPEDPASNFGMIQEALLVHVPITQAHVHRMEAESSDRQAAAERYELLLPPVPDLLLLGMGTDGHTASLFPDDPATRETVRRVVPVLGPTAPRERLSITPAVISAAREVLVLVSGAEKASMIVRVIEGPEDPRALPAQLARAGTWLLDQSAASLLRHPGA